MAHISIDLVMLWMTRISMKVNFPFIHEKIRYQSFVVDFLLERIYNIILLIYLFNCILKSYDMPHMSHIVWFICPIKVSWWIFVNFLQEMCINDRNILAKVWNQKKVLSGVAASFSSWPDFPAAWLEKISCSS